MNTDSLAMKSKLASNIHYESNSRLFSTSGRDFSADLHEIWATVFLQNIRGQDFLGAFFNSADDMSEFPASKHILPIKQSDGAYFILFLYVAFIGAALNNFIEDTPKLRSVLSRSYRLLLGKARYHFRSSYLAQFDFFNRTIDSNSLWSGQHYFEPTVFRSVKTSFFVFCMDEPFEKTLLAHSLLSQIETSELQQIISYGGESVSDSQYLVNGYNVFALFEQVKSYQRGISRLKRMLTIGAKNSYEMNSVYRLLVDECNSFLTSHLGTALTVSRKDFIDDSIRDELAVAEDP